MIPNIRTNFEKQAGPDLIERLIRTRDYHAMMYEQYDAVTEAIDTINALQSDKAKLREEIIAILNQRIEDVRACNAQPLVARFMAIDEIDWLEETKAALQETER